MSHDETEDSSSGGIWDRLRALEDAPMQPVKPQAQSPQSALGQRQPPRQAPQTAPTHAQPHAGGAQPGTGQPMQYYVGAQPAQQGAPGQQPHPGQRPGQAQQPGYGGQPGQPGQAGQGRPTNAAQAGAAYQQNGPAGAPPQPPRQAPPQQRQQPAGPQPKKTRSRKRWYRPKLRWFFLYLPLLIMLFILGLGVWGWRTVQDLGRVDVGDALAPVSGDAVNYLIVGSDSRDGADEEAADAAAIGNSDLVAGARADTIIVLRVEPTRSLMMSIPRDLWATNVSTGNQGRINGTFNQGPDNLIRSVTANLGIPINHYVEVDFVSFSAMVDAMGGITIDFEHPAFDPKSGLRVISDGPVVLDGQNALAYVRSRQYTEIIDGQEVVEPTADLGRQQRQQIFIRTVLKSVGEERYPITLARVAGAAAKGVRVDQEIGFGDMITLARRLGNGDPETRILPTTNVRKGNAAVLELIDAEALPILIEFGAG